MTKFATMLLGAAGTALAIGGSLALPSSAAAAMPVFDATNYSQNLLQAARALEQINKQVQSLQNEAAMLRNMATNLERVSFPELDRIKSAMQRIDQLMGEGQGIGFRVDRLDDKVRSLFPGASAALGRDQRVASARARLDAAEAGYRQSIALQSQVADNIREDAELLAGLAGRSQGSVGALQAQQAANQLLALSVKQQLQLQNLMASEFRGASIDRARRAQAEEDGRAATRRFLGQGSAYTRRRD